MNTSHQRSFSVSQSEYPFESHWFERNGTFLHYVDEGQDLPVMMLHGNPTWSFLYRKVIKQLNGSVRSIAPDLPGFGYSDHPPDYDYEPHQHADWIDSLTDHLSLDRFILVMQDWGGPIGMSIAVNRPDRVAGLVICNTWCWPQNNLETRIFSSLAGGPIGKYLILKRNFFARRLMPLGMTNPDSKTSEVLKAYTDPFPTPESRMGTYVFPKALKTSSHWLSSIESKLHLLADKPLEMVMGERDPALGKVEVVERWHRYFPGAPAERVPDAGHFLQEDRPDRLVVGIKRVVERIR